MTPRFNRARKFAEPHAMLVVDLLFTVIWLSAFATQAAYNTANLCGAACNLRKAIVCLGVFKSFDDNSANAITTAIAISIVVEGLTIASL